MLIKEFDPDHHRRLVDKLMTSKGYKKLGAGSDAVVYEKDSGNVIKIIIPESGDQNPANNTFQAFLDYCRKHKSNPHLPRFAERPDSVMIDGEEFKQVVMEKLGDVSDPIIREILAILAGDDANSSIYNSSDTWQEALEEIHETKDWGGEYNGLSDETRELLQTRPWPTDKQLTRIFAKFFVTAKGLFKDQRFAWDLHADNVMQRADGTLVIVDPWVS